MKALTYACLLLVLSPAFAQETPSKEPFKGANLILIKPGRELSDDQLYQALGQTLVSAGYTIEVNNRDFLQLRTAYLVMSDYLNLKYLFTATIANNQIRIQPTIDMGPPIGETEWAWYKAKGTKYHIVHDDILKKLKALGEVWYSKM